MTHEKHHIVIGKTVYLFRKPIWPPPTLPTAKQHLSLSTHTYLPKDSHRTTIESQNDSENVHNLNNTDVINASPPRLQKERPIAEDNPSQKFDQIKKRLIESHQERKDFIATLKPNSLINQGHKTHLHNGGGFIFEYDAAKVTTTLKDDLEALVAEATRIAFEQGIATASDVLVGEGEATTAALKMLGGWDEKEHLEMHDIDTMSTIRRECKPTDCAPFGSCDSTSFQCKCLSLYKGKTCGHPLKLTWPTLPKFAEKLSLVYLSDLVLLRHTVQGQEELLLNTSRGEIWKASRLADRRMITKLLPVLPETDAELRGKMYASCAVVGSSGGILLHELGQLIDGAQAVFRVNSAPTKGFEEIAGTKTTFRMTSGKSLGYQETDDEIVLLKTESENALKGLLWNAHQNKPKITWIATHPDWESHLDTGLPFAPSAGLSTVLLALQVCQKLVLYGFGLSTAHGVPHIYYNGCAKSESPERDSKERQLLTSLASAGVLEFGETCASMCMEEDGASCGKCRRDHGIDITRVGLPATICMDDAGYLGSNNNRENVRYEVPWV